MARFAITAVNDTQNSVDTEVFEGSSAEEAAFRAGFSMGAYWVLMIPPETQGFIGDVSIEEAGGQVSVTVVVV
jgi:hypothetical protein